MLVIRQAGGLVAQADDGDHDVTIVVLDLAVGEDLPAREQDQPGAVAGDPEVGDLIAGRGGGPPGQRYRHCSIPLAPRGRYRPRGNGRGEIPHRTDLLPSAGTRVLRSNP